MIRDYAGNDFENVVSVANRGGSGILRRTHKQDRKDTFPVTE